MIRILNYLLLLPLLFAYSISNGNQLMELVKTESLSVTCTSKPTGSKYTTSTLSRDIDTSTSESLVLSSTQSHTTESSTFVEVLTNVKEENSFILKNVSSFDKVELIDLAGRKVSFEVEPVGNAWSITPHHINCNKHSFILLITNHKGEFLSKRVDLF